LSIITIYYKNGIYDLEGLSEINSEKKDRLSSGSTVEKCFYRIITAVVRL